MDAIETILLAESGFQVDTPDATAALKTATALLEWCKKAENTIILKEFSKSLISNLKQCLGNDKQLLRTRKSRMWGHYHQLRTSENFVQEWKNFLSKSVLSEQASPTFFQ